MNEAGRFDLASLSSTTLRASAAAGLDSPPTVLVPTGSTEQHGPHLPFATDTLVAAAVAAGVAARLNAGASPTAVVVAPALPFGASGEHQHFAGTVSIGHEALRSVLVELVRSLSTWAARIVFVNGHGGNVPSLVDAVTQMIAEQHSVGWLPCSSSGAQPIDATSDSHAGRIETSLLLHLQPHLVDLSLAVPGNTAPLTTLLPLMRAGGVAAVSPTGILGDPTGASATEGAELYESMVATVTALLQDGAPDARGRLTLGTS